MQQSFTAFADGNSHYLDYKEDEKSYSTSLYLHTIQLTLFLQGGAE